MNDKHSPDIGKQISDTVRTALESGDLSRLKEIGPTVQNAVRETIANSLPNTGNTPSAPTAPQPPAHAPKNQPENTGGTYYQQQSSWQQSQQHSVQSQGWASRSGGLRPTLPRGNYGMGSVVFGVMGMVGFGLAAIAFGTMAMVAGVLGGLLYVAMGLLVPFLLSLGLLGGGIGKRGLIKRLRAYMVLLSDKTVLAIEEISAATGRGAARVRRDIRRGIEKKILRDIRMDVMETCVIRGGEAYRLYVETEEARKQRETEAAEHRQRMEDPNTAPIEVFRAEGKNTIRKIREANQAIPGAEISLKLEKLEATTTRIFSYVDAHPEKLPDTRKFMNYYLPTTLKLVEKYRQYEEIDVEMENVRQAKADITKTLDTIDLAFNNLLESLYKEDTLDVVTDIEVLETMLEQEGLTSKKFDIDAG